MATIEKRTNGSYRVKVRKHGQHVSASFPSKRMAQEWARKVETELAEAKHLPATLARKYTLADLITRFRETEFEGKRLNTVLSYDVHLRWWNDRLGALRLADITPERIEDAKHALAQAGRKPATVHAYLRTLSVILKKARRWKWISRNPLEDVDKPSLKGSHRTRFLNDAERQALLDACAASTSGHLLPVVKLALGTGMRKSEILALRWSQIDLQRGVIHLGTETKSHQARTVPLSQPLRHMLAELGKVRAISGLVFPSETDPSKPACIKEAWYAAVKRAGIKDVVFHDLRHTAASYIVQAGGTLGDVAAILGHHSVVMAQRYAHLAEDNLKKTADLVAARVFGE